MTDTPSTKWARLRQAATETERVKQRFDRNASWRDVVEAQGQPLLLFSDAGMTGGAALHADDRPSFDLHVRWAGEAARREPALHAAAAWLSERFGVPTNVLVDDAGAHLEIHGESLPIDDALLALDSLRWIATGAEGRRDPFSVLGEVSMGGLPAIDLGDDLSVIAPDDWGLAYVLADSPDTLLLQRRFGPGGRPESLLVRRLGEDESAAETPAGLADRVGYPLSPITGPRADELIEGAGLPRGLVWRVDDGGVLGHDDARRVIERSARFWNNQAALDAAGLSMPAPRFESIGASNATPVLERPTRPAAAPTTARANEPVGGGGAHEKAPHQRPRTLAGHNPYLSKTGESRPLYSSLASDRHEDNQSPVAALNAGASVQAPEDGESRSPASAVDVTHRPEDVKEPPRAQEKPTTAGTQPPQTSSGAPVSTPPSSGNALKSRAEALRLEEQAREADRARALDVLKQRFQASEGAADALPEADAEGLFDITLITPGFDPARTAHLLSIVLGIDRIDAEKMCDEAPSRVLSGVPAPEVRRIDSVVRPASGARFDASPHEE